jgi:hypothetical protein
MKRILRWIVKAVLLAVVITFTLLLSWAFESRTMPALCVWHTVFLSEEFTARDATPQSTLQDYLDREDRLFQELKEKIYDRVALTKDMTYCRYYDGGIQDPEALGATGIGLLSWFLKKLKAAPCSFTASPTRLTVCVESEKSFTPRGSMSSGFVCPPTEPCRAP